MFLLSVFSVLSVAFISSTFAQLPALPSTQPAFRIVGHIDSPRIPESSGLVPSHRFAGIYWTHNDSDNPAAVFAITREGKLIAEFPIINARNVDWEDIAIDEQNRLYMADIGDNAHNRSEIDVYRVPEPDPNGKVVPIHADRVWRLLYPEKPFDAESLFLLNGNGYIISKYLDMTPAAIYRFSLDAPPTPTKLEKVLTLPLRVPVTAADLSADHRWLAVMSLIGPFIFRIDGDVNRAAGPWEWEALFIDPHVEGVCFVPGGLLATTEGRRVIFFPWKPPATQGAGR